MEQNHKKSSCSVEGKKTNSEEMEVSILSFQTAEYRELCPRCMNCLWQGQELQPQLRISIHFSEIISSIGSILAHRLFCAPVSSMRNKVHPFKFSEETWFEVIYLLCSKCQALPHTDAGVRPQLPAQAWPGELSGFTHWVWPLLGVWITEFQNSLSWKGH